MAIFPSLAGNDTSRVVDHDRLSGEDLTFWWSDSPMQPTTMAMLLVLERS